MSKQVLNDARAKTKVNLYPGSTYACWHGFGKGHLAQIAIEGSKEALKWLLAKGKS